MVTDTRIGQSAAKLRIGERSTTNHLPWCRDQAIPKWRASRVRDEDIVSSLVKAKAAGHAAGRMLRILSKITKGVVGKIYPDHAMPVDEFGIKADLWIDMNSPVARNNAGQLYETGATRILEFGRREVSRVYELRGSEPAFETLTDLYNDFNPNYAKIVREECKSVEDRKRVVKDAIENSPRVWVPPYLDTFSPQKDKRWNALINIRAIADKWGVRSSPITYKTLQADGSFKEFTTIAHFSIGSKYIIQLHKIPEQFAPGPAAVNHIGIPTKSPYESKNYPVSTNPYRYGEDELRVMAMDTSILEVTRFQSLLSNSPTGTTATIRSILMSEHPTRIRRIPISNGDLGRTNAVHNLFHNTTAVLGVETKNTKVENFEVSDDLTNAIWDSDVVGDKDAKISMFDDDDENKVPKRSLVKRGKLQKMFETLDDFEADSEDDVSEE